MNIIYGFKCFKKGLISNYGDYFEEGKVYHVSNPIYGKNGYHICMNLEDTLRFFDTFKEEVDIAYVKGYGDINESFDDYNEYYHLYSCEYLEIIHVLTREEIINYALNLSFLRVKRFLELFKLSLDELKLFEEKYKNNSYVNSSINYYQKRKVM